jgi:hypothetical protein
VIALTSEQSSNAEHWIVIAILASAAVILPWPAPAEGQMNPSAPARIPKNEIPDDQLTGRDIYKRVLDNQFDSFLQESTLSSGDRSGHVQATRVRMWFQNTEDSETQSHSGGVVSKTLVRYLDPFDLRHTGYLVINNLNRRNDQYVYLNSTKQVRRVDLRGEAVFGTDFSFEDIVPRELEDSTYLRLPDEIVEDRPCFLVEATPKEHVDSEYSKIRIYVEKERSVVLHSRYWDAREIQVKQLDVDPERVREINGVWVPHLSNMRNLKMDSFTVLEVSEIEPNIQFARNHFDLTRLIGH